MKVIGIIPARMGSSRFPGKPMAKILGIPMIGHCYLRSKLSKRLDEVYVATCDEVIFNYIQSIGGKAILTADSHTRASDRTAEALLKIEEQQNEKYDIVLMIQGDEPMLTPEMLVKSFSLMLTNKDVLVTNLMSKIESIVDHDDPNEVKVVVDKNNDAIYFSREAIPSRRKGSSNPTMLKQVCLISFRRDFLLQYTKMKETPLEIFESVDMLRIIENGFKVKMIPIDDITFAVDTREDLEKVEELMKDDELRNLYYQFK